MHVNRDLVLFVVVLGGALLYPIFLLYVYLPLKVRRKQTREPQYTPVELTQMPEEVARAFLLDAPDLAAAGFSAVAHLSSYVASSDQNAYVSCWVNRETGDSAQLIAVKTPGVPTAILTTFRTEFTDGTEIVTSNSNQPSCFPRPPRLDVVTCSNVYDLDLLLRVHRARVSRGAAGRTSTVERASDGPASLRHEWDETFGRLTKLWYYKVDPASGCYVMTIKGGYLSTYRLLWPFKSIQLARRDRRAGRVLGELGFGDLDTLRRHQRHRPPVLAPPPHQPGFPVVPSGQVSTSEKPLELIL